MAPLAKCCLLARFDTSCTAVEARCSITACAGDFNDQTAEPWGDVLCQAYTTAHGSDGLLVGVRQDVCVQVFPVYPFLQRSILQCRPVYDVQGCPTFVLWLPRDLNAHLFWKRRDLLAPYFWNNDGSPGAPIFLPCQSSFHATSIARAALMRTAGPFGSAPQEHHGACSLPAAAHGAPAAHAGLARAPRAL